MTPHHLVLLAGLLGVVWGGVPMERLRGWEAVAESRLPAGTTGAAVSTGCCGTAFLRAPPEWTTATAMGVLAGDGDALFHEDRLKGVDTAQFDEPWWFRASVALAPAAVRAAGRVLLHVRGVNYRADVWVDGVRVAAADAVVGTFRAFTLDVTAAVRAHSDGAPHTVAFRVARPHNQWGSHKLNETDLAISFVDWNPEAPDSNMGVWQPVDIELVNTTGVTVEHPFVSTALRSDSTTVPTSTISSTASATKDTTTAEVTVVAYLHNWDTETPRTGTVHAVLGGKLMCTRTNVTVPAGATQQIVLAPTDCPALVIENPKLWWPYQMGTPTLHRLEVTFEEKEENNNSKNNSNTTETYTATSEVGLREITSELSADERTRLYRVNGRPLLVRGAGWTPDLFLRMAPARYAQELAYVRHMRLNAVRLEGKFEHDEFYALADRAGLLVLDGWSCGDAWERWDLWTAPVCALASASVRAQARRLAAHACVLAFLVGSDYHPPAAIERDWLRVFAEERWPNAVLSSATERVSDVSGRTGVKMSGPYSWVPPHYFLTDTARQYGGAWGFLTEGGPGENPLRAGSVERVFAPAHAQEWPLNASVWHYHCGNAAAKFSTLDMFVAPLERRYGAVRSFADFQRKAAAAVYDSHRALFEAYTRNRYGATGVVHWMLNNAWPSNIWHLYDWYLSPTPAYFAARKGCAPLHALYGYDDNSVYLVNNLWEPYTPPPATASSTATSTPTPLTVRATIISATDGATVHSIKEVSVTTPVAADSTARVLRLNALPAAEPVFVHLEVAAGAHVLERNTYWLRADMDELDWEHSTFYNVPILRYADFSALERLPAAHLRATVAHSTAPHSTVESTLTEGTNATRLRTTVRLRNTGPALALLAELRLVVGTTPVLPVLWSDNYVSLPAGDAVTLTAEYTAADLAAAGGSTVVKPSVVVEGWNIASQTLHTATASSSWVASVAAASA